MLIGKGYTINEKLSSIKRKEPLSGGGIAALGGRREIDQ